METNQTYTVSDVTEDLTAAAMWGDVSLLESFLSNGADPNLTNAQGNTALHVACYYGERECASILLDYKADVNARGADGKTPLHRAVLGVLVLEPGPKYITRDQINENQIDLVKLLVGRGAKVGLRDSSGDSPYDLAIQCDFYVCAELLDDLAKAEQQEEIRQAFFQKLDDIYVACERGNLEKVKELLPDVFVVLNQSKKYHMTLLMMACQEGHLPVVEYLVNEGATATRSPDPSGKTALHFASENGHAEIVQFLIKRLPRFIIYDECSKGTSLHLAARNGHAGVVKVILEAANHGLNCQTPSKDTLSVESSLDDRPPESHINVLAQSPIEGRTPLHEAVIGGHTEVVQLLVQWLKENHFQKKVGFSSTSTISPLPSPSAHQSSPFSPKTPQTPLSGAIPRTPSQSHANPIDSMTEMGRTPLQEAAHHGHMEMIEMLLDAGADINAVMRPSLDRTANADLTALVQAVLANDVTMVKFLLQHGATDARLKALTRAIRFSYKDVVGLLLCYNGTVTVDSANMELRKRAGKESVDSSFLLSINWASKKLSYIESSWIDLVLLESPKPKADSYSISQLNLSDNKLTDLPLGVFQIKSLIRLDVSRNEINSLPSGDWTCCSLNYFDISHNHLMSLPLALFTLPELKELLCNNNAIREVPLKFWQAPKLQKFHLQRNKLESFPSPTTLSDSGFGTLEVALPEPSFHASFSVPDFSYMATSPPANVSPVQPPRSLTDHRRVSLPDRKVSDRRTSLPPSSNFFPSKLRELFNNDIDDDIFEEYEMGSLIINNKKNETSGSFCLESLDLSYNQLTSLPNGLCCLAPKLQKLILHHNKLKSAGNISDIPADLELLDLNNNQLTSSIACAPPRESLRNYVCAQKLLQTSQSNATPTRCSHRNHRVLRRLSYLKLAHNQLVDVQLFRTVERNQSLDLTSSMDESRLARRSKSYGEMSYVQRDIAKSSVGLKSKGSASSEGSSDESKDKRGEGGNSSVEVLYCLFPQLSTLDLGSNKLRSVPASIELITSLSVLTISYNNEIDTLPLEISNLEGLWSLEYDGVPLTNPPAGDLDKFRSAAEKLFYMRSLLHDAKPYESMKLMLVGLQKQGKTTLLSRMREINEARTPVSTYNERVEGEIVSAAPSLKPAGFFRRVGSASEPLSTVGVDLGLWKYRKDLEPSYRGKKTTPLPSVTFYTWDFGGQEEYYATHQCFLSNRSLYLVIFNVIDGEEGIDSLGIWLHNIQARAPDSPVVIVGTHCDMLKGDVDKEQRKKELTQYLENKFSIGKNPQQLRELGLPQIKQVMFVGCTPGGRAEGVTELRVALYNIAFSLTAPRRKGTIGVSKAKLLEQPIPSSYLKLEERVKELAMLCQQDKKDVSPVMREAEFHKTVEDIIPNSRELNQAVTFLHENGILLHYATPALNHLYFIDPQWLCDMLAHVVTVPEVNRFIQRGSGPEAGILKTSVLSQIFKGKLFPHDLRNEYIQLLEKFEVALLLDRNRMLVPSMLPLCPRYTIHRFRAKFPRPPISHILKQAQRQLSETNEDNFTSFSSISDPLVLPVPKSFSAPKTPEIYCTGLILRRYYFMTYVPSGFWPRLLTRFLTSSDMVKIVLRALGFTEKQIDEVVKNSGDMSSFVNLEWSYWATGVEFWYQESSLLRVAEIRPEGTFHDCLPSSQGTCRRIPTVPFEPSEDCEDLSFQLCGQWMAVDMTPNTGVEVLVPDYICPSVIEQQDLFNIEDMDDSPKPLRESSWMSAQLLSQIVHLIDTLLEDWFPGIGAKDGNKTLYSIPYVNRVVPCPYCVGGTDAVSNDVVTGQSTVTSSDRSDSQFSSISKNDDSEVFQEPVCRDLLPSFKKSSHSPQSIRKNIRKSTGSETESPFNNLELVQASRFGFMIETCVAASRGLDTLICPTHSTQPLDIMSLTPDLVFGDLPSHYIIDKELVDHGNFVASGSFGEIYHGAIYPHKSASDDEGREVAIKIDKQDRKHFNMETATKAYIEIRAEVALLKDLNHDFIIQFIGLTLQPLCFMLEWAPQKSLHGLLESYNKADARISPWTLADTAFQVASGLAYLHCLNVVYYDLKSPNILVFKFPTADESLQVSLGYTSVKSGKFPVHVKIADLGISRKITPGGVVGYKGTPAFMAPEILRYVGMEACTEKVDVFSFGMFMYELLAQQFPFERQNLMHNQIEKLVVEGERPSIQNKELNNPILFLNIMKWAWEQDYHNRPSASKLESLLSSPEIPHLIDAYSLHGFCYPKVSSACLVTLPIDISNQVPEESISETSLTTSLSHTNVVQGDLQEEIWFCSTSENLENQSSPSQISVVSFCGRANFLVDSIQIDCSPVTAMCCVNQQVWLGTKDSEVILYDAVNRSKLFSRHLAIFPGLSIVCISHLTKLRQVLVARSDGCLLLFDEYLLEQRIPDSSHFDNRLNMTQLPVRSVSNLKFPLICALTFQNDDNTASVWCGSTNELILAVTLTSSQFYHCDKLMARTYTETSSNDIISHMCLMRKEANQYVWVLSHPDRVLHLWDAKNRKLLATTKCNDFTIHKVTHLLALHDTLYVATSNSQITAIQFDDSFNITQPSCSPINAHTGGIHTMLSLDSRIFPRQWIPTIIGRSNVIEYYKDLLEEEEIASINSRIVGHQSRLLVTIGQGFQGFFDSRIKNSSLEGRHDDYVLLWLPPK